MCTNVWQTGSPQTAAEKIRDGGGWLVRWLGGKVRECRLDRLAVQIARPEPWTTLKTLFAISPHRCFYHIHYHYFFPLPLFPREFRFLSLFSCFSFFSWRSGTLKLALFFGLNGRGEVSQGRAQSTTWECCPWQRSLIEQLESAPRVLGHKSKAPKHASWPPMHHGGSFIARSKH